MADENSLSVFLELRIKLQPQRCFLLRTSAKQTANELREFILAALFSETNLCDGGWVEEIIAGICAKWDLTFADRSFGDNGMSIRRRGVENRGH